MNAPDTSGLPDTPLQWDVFCQVIDNFGDIGVCWRFAADLAARGQQVRLWVDDASALAWMAPEGCEGVDVRPWHSALPGPDDLQPEGIVVFPVPSNALFKMTLDKNDQAKGNQ